MMRRLRWYHLYILLATVDIVVIACGLWLHHRTLDSFEELLARAASFDARERDLAALNQGVIQLCAPAFEVCRTRDVAEQRARFSRFQYDLGALKARLRIGSKQISGFWDEIGRLCLVQDELFEKLDRAAAAPDPGKLISLLADIDAHRRAAQRLLADRQEGLLSDAAEHHLEHAALLSRQWIAEIVLAAGLVGALAGMGYYTRRLQHTDEALRTVKKRVQEERRERLAMIGELCTGVAHGIQNPLAAIRSSTELMLDMGTMDGVTRSRAEDVMAECTRLSRRVRRLLGFARAAEPERMPVNVAGIVSGVVREMAPRIQSRAIEVSQYFPDEPLVVDADPDELASVFLELISNAVDHTPSGGRIELSAHAAAGFIVVIVRDSGAGVPSGTANHIFDLFFTTREDGTGVGLAWARRIVKSLDGALELDPAGGPGATFRVKFPRSTRLQGSGAPDPVWDEALPANSYV